MEAMVSMMVLLVTNLVYDGDKTYQVKQKKAGTVKRARRNVYNIMYELGSYSHCFFRMR